MRSGRCSGGQASRRACGQGNECGKSTVLDLASMLLPEAVER
jgi:hypothetical protein